MQDEAKTKEQLIMEVYALRERNAELEKKCAESMRAEEALRESNEKYLKLAESIPGMVFQYVQRQDGSFDLPYVNSRIIEYSGMTPEAVMADPPLILAPIHPDDREMIRQAIAVSARTLDTFSAEHRVIDANGQIRWFSVVSTPQLLSNGDILWNGVSIEITERKRVREALRKGEAVLRQIIDLVPHRIFVKRGDGKYLLVNKAVAEAYGMTVSALTAKYQADFHPDKSELEQMLLDDLEVITKGETKFVAEEAFTDSKGNLRFFQTTKVPFEVADERVPAVLGVSMDITERKRTERVLRESEEKFRILVESSPDAIFIQKDGRFLYVNDATVRLFGATSDEEILGREIVEWVHLDYRAIALERIRAVKEERQGTPLTKLKGVKVDGTVVDVEAYSKPIMYRESPCSLVFVRDTTDRNRMEEALRQACLYTRSLIEASLDPLVTISPEGKITDVNEAAIKATGVERQKLIGTDFSTYFTEPELAREGYRKVFEEGFVTDYPLTMRHSNGKLTHVLYNSSVYKNEGGKVMGIFAAARDITERKKAEESLLISEDRYRRLFEDSVLGIYRSTPDGKFIDVNPAFARMFGFGSPEDAVSQIRNAAVDIYVDPSIRNEIFRRILDGDGPVQLESLYKRKDGSMFTGNIHAWAVRDRAGNFLYTEGFVEDVTERKRAEIALRESKAYLSAAIENIPFEFWVIGSDGRYSMQNRAARARYGDIIGKRPEDICPNETILSVWQDNNRRAYMGEMVHGEVKYAFGDEERYFYNVIAPIRDSDKTIGIVGTNVDITARKRLEAALKRVNTKLESQVEERTKELSAKTRRLEEFNAALNVLLKKREEDKSELEESVLLNVKSLVVPYVEKLKSRLTGDQLTYLTILESHIREITTPFIKRLSEKYFGLSPLEIQTVGLIREGKTTQEIAEMLCVSENTVSSHRFHIRKKLGLSNKKVNLRNYLKTLDD
jgi:PAS domain S-box-containing protein